ncbi:MAG: molybdate ABC transporter substrate-binding protein [Pseudomonadota bacterium]|nr:molybdate ABC transporter substrate-binding protein [Pseudomonadota bacterium]
MFRRYHLCLALMFSLFAAPLWAEQITVFAAASLRNALEEVGDTWTENTGHRLRYSFAGSSALARQVEAGAPADLIILANEAWMDHLEGQRLLQQNSRVDLLGNALALIGPTGAAPLDLGPGILERLGDGRMAMALVNAVPAGIYGKAALETLGLWQEIAPQVAQTDNVRAALALVALGEAPLGIVYHSDALAEPRVQQLARFPSGSHPAILYPAALTTDSRSEAAAELLEHLQSPIAKEVFLRHGFTIPSE